MVKEFKSFNNLSITEKSDFSIFFKQNKVYISKKNISLNKWLYINKVECEVLDISFPYDLSRGTKQLKNNRTKLSILEGIIKEQTIKELFENATNKDRYQNIELNFNKDSITVKAVHTIKDNPNEYIPFIFKIGIYIQNDKLFLVLLEDYILGLLPSLRYKFIEDFFDIPNITNHSLNIYSIKIFPNLLNNIFPIQGYKVPNYRKTIFKELDIENGIIKFQLADSIEEDLPQIPTIKNTIATLEIYKQNEELFYKLINDKITDDDFKEITDIKNINKDRSKQKLFIEFLDNSFASIDILKTLSERHIDYDVTLDIAIKLAQFNSVYRFEELMQKLIVKLKNNNQNNILEMIYLYLGYYYKKNNDKKSIYYFEKLWNLNRKYHYAWKDFFKELIKYENWFLAIEIGEYIAPKSDDEEYFWDKMGDIFSSNIKDLNKSLEYYTRVLRVSPELIPVKLKILDIYTLQDKNLFVIDRLNQLIDENKGNLYLKVEVDKRLAKLWYKEKHYERAIFHIEQALKEHKSPLLYYMAYESSIQLKDDLRAFEYLKMALNYYENYQIDRDELYFKVIYNVAKINFDRGELIKAYEHLISIPKNILNIEMLDLINNLLLMLDKKDEIFKYMELKEKLIDSKDEKILFWQKNINFLSDNQPDSIDLAKSYLKRAIIEPNNDDFFYDFEEVKNNLTEIDIKYKIIELYLKRAKICSSEFEKGDLYYKVFKIAMALNDKDTAYKSLKNGLEKSPKHKVLKLTYKKWINDKKRY